VLAHLVAVKDRVVALPVIHDLVRAYARADGLRFMRWAAAIAVFAYLSIFPLLVLGFIAFGVVLQHFPSVQVQVEDFLKDSLPLLFDPQGGPEAVDIQAVAHATKTAGFVSVGALVLTGLGWISASIEGVRRMQGAMHRSRNALVSKAEDVVTFLVLGTVLLVALLTAVLVQVAANSLLEWVDLSSERARLVALVAPVASGAIVWVVLATLYTGAWWSRPHRQFRAPAVAAAASSIVLVVLAQASLLIVGRTLTNPVYGTLAIAAALLVFLYIASAVMLYFAAWVAVVEGAPATQEETAYAARKGADIALPVADPVTTTSPDGVSAAPTDDDGAAATTPPR
jgi:membrane protein